MRKRLGLCAAVCAALVAPASQAHHSFAVYFDPDAEVTITGTVQQFRFTNPHGTVVVDVDGQQWRAETNAPVVLRRRGWDRSSIRPGETVTISGWRARDGRPYMRLREARNAAGELIGNAPFGQNDD